MENFDLETFDQTPSLEQLNSCRKAELQQIADFYKKIVCGSLKTAMRQQIMSALVDQKVFSSDAASKFLQAHTLVQSGQLDLPRELAVEKSQHVKELELELKL